MLSVSKDLPSFTIFAHFTRLITLSTIRKCTAQQFLFKQSLLWVEAICIPDLSIRFMLTFACLGAPLHYFLWDYCILPNSPYLPNFCLSSLSTHPYSPLLYLIYLTLIEHELVFMCTGKVNFFLSLSLISTRLTKVNATQKKNTILYSMSIVEEGMERKCKKAYTRQNYV